MIPLKTYDLTQVILTIDGLRVEGFGEDDAISYEMAADDIDDRVSADGQVTASRTNDDRVYCDLTVTENTAGCQLLGELQVAQQEQSTFTPLNFLMNDPLSGETVESQYAVFKTHPAPDKGKLVGERVFRLLLPNAKRAIRYASSVTQ